MFVDVLQIVDVIHVHPGADLDHRLHVNRDDPALSLLAVEQVLTLPEEPVELVYERLRQIPVSEGGKTGRAEQGYDVVVQAVRDFGRRGCDGVYRQLVDLDGTWEDRMRTRQGHWIFHGCTKAVNLGQILAVVVWGHWIFHGCTKAVNLGQIWVVVV
jgi:hypothetical protein